MQEIGGYRLEHQIGAGGMGTVWRAYDAEDRAVAFKLLHPHISKDPNARARLSREVDLLHRVRGPRVAQVVDAEVDDDDAFVVTELIDGPTLSEDVDREGAFNSRELEGLAVGLAEALHSIHRVGVVHRDLKPGNVMMSPTGPVLIDFGISQIADDTRLTQTGMVTGTPGYLDPEVINGGTVTSACDWWSWAAVLAFAATGRAPYGSGPPLTVIKRMSDHIVDLEDVDPLIADALFAALHPESAKRLPPESVIEVIGGRWDGEDLRIALAELESAPAVIPPAGAPGSTAVLPGATAVLPEPARTEYVAAPRPEYVPVPGYGSGPGPDPAPPPHADWQITFDDDLGRSGVLQPLGSPPAWALPGKPSRFLVFAVGSLCVAAAAVTPVWSATALVVLALVTAVWGRLAASRRWRAATRGTRRGDGARTFGDFFVQLLVAFLTLLVTLVIVTAIATAVLYVVGDTRTVPAAPALWAAAALLALMLWIGPGSKFSRQGARLAVRDLFPLRPMRVALVVLVLAGVAGVGLAVLNGMEPQWHPLPDPPVDVLTPWP